MAEKRSEELGIVRQYWNSLSQKEQRQYLTSPSHPYGLELAIGALSFRCSQIAGDLSRESLLGGKISNYRHRQRFIETLEFLGELIWALPEQRGESRRR